MFPSSKHLDQMCFHFATTDLRVFAHQLSQMAITAKRDHEAEVEKEFGPRPEGGYQMVPPQGYFEITQMLPRLMWNSVLVLIWSHFERAMIDAYRGDCFQEATIKGLNEPTPVRTLGGVQKYWKTRSVDYESDNDWKELDDVRRVRNYVVHENGTRPSEVDLSSMTPERRAESRSVLGGQEKDLDEVEKYFARRISEGRTGASFLGTEMVLSSDFCAEVIDVCERFFDKLLKMIPDTDERLWKPPGGFKPAAS